MKYKDLLAEQRSCPFCGDTKQQEFIESEHSYLTYALAPYHKHHMLVIPKRHVVDFTELTKEEWLDSYELTQRAAVLLNRFGYSDYSLLIRNGSKTEKSIDHAHFHLIPNIGLGPTDGKGADREILTAEEIEAFKEEIRGLLNS